jgi:hypothetical protein
MAASRFYIERLDVPVLAAKNRREQFAKKLAQTIVEANIEFKRGTRYTLAAEKKPFNSH